MQYQSCFAAMAQTSALRLPRKLVTKNRVLYARPATLSECSTPAKERTNCVDRETKLTNATDAVAAIEIPPYPASTAGTAFEATKARVGTAPGTSRMHVRMGLEGIQDADQGQQPTVWAVEGGSSANGERRSKNCIAADYIAPHHFCTKQPSAGPEGVARIAQQRNTQRSCSVRSFNVF